MEINFDELLAEAFNSHDNQIPSDMMSNTIGPESYQTQQYHYQPDNSTQTTMLPTGDNTLLHTILNEVRHLKSQQDSVMNSILSELQTFNFHLTKLQCLDTSIQQLNHTIDKLQKSTYLEMEVTSTPVKLPIEIDLDKTSLHKLVNALANAVKQTQTTSSQQSTSRKRKTTVPAESPKKQKAVDKHQLSVATGQGKHEKNINNFKIPCIPKKKN